MDQVTIFDSTLRDGAQGGGVAFSIEDKLAVTRLLDQLGVQYIEAGNPGSNAKELEFFCRVSQLSLKHAELVAFGSTCRKGLSPEEDPNLASLLKADTAVCAIFGKCWKFHVDAVLETTAQENFRMIRESCRYLKARGRKVIFDAEHFFDGYLEDPVFAKQAIRSALEGGADVICLCDTNGGVFPKTAARIVREVLSWLPVPLGVHFHNDMGMATANSLIAVQEGANQVQGTFLGFGERC